MTTYQAQISTNFINFTIEYKSVIFADEAKINKLKQTKRLVCEIFFKNSGIGNDRNSTYLVIQTDTVTAFIPL